MKLKTGLKLIADEAGSGPLVKRQQHYVLAIRLRLNRGEIIFQPDRCLSHSVDGGNRVCDDGFFHHRVRINRECLIAGIFYGLDGMKVGGKRTLIISPHLAYSEKGIPGLIPPNAVITAEIHVVSEVLPMEGS